jgi:hypothetical protein
MGPAPNQAKYTAKELLKGLFTMKTALDAVLNLNS